MPSDSHPCPRCKKDLGPSWMCDNNFFSHSWRRLDLPYFLCGDCRVAFVDKLLLRDCISSWRKSEKGLTRRISFRDAYAKARESVARVLDYYARNYKFTGNGIINGVNALGNYPSGNTATASVSSTGFTDPSANDYSLTTSSPFKGKAVDGKDPGADIAALNSTISGVVQ